LSAVPLAFFEGQQNSYVSPVQEELQFIGVKSLLGIRLRSSEGTHGCVILQQCDYRRAWTRNEIDMVQNVADKVADALYKLPAEKRAREPIMQLHQRIVAPTAPADGGDAFSKIENVRRALKGALGQQAIPSARKGGPSPAPAKPAAAPAPAAPPAAAQSSPVQAPPQVAPGQAPAQAAPGQSSFAPPGANPGAAQGLPAAASGPGAALARAADPFADLDFGDISDIGESSTPAAAAPAAPAVDPNKTWDKMAPVFPPDSLLNPGNGIPAASAQASSPGAQAPFAPPVTQPPVAPSGTNGASTAAGAASSAPAAEAPAGNNWGSLDSIPTPASAPKPGAAWGDLDSIPAPATAPGRGLGGGMLGKARANTASRPMFNKGRVATETPPQVEHEAIPAAPIDDVAAQAKLNQLMSKSNEASDYVFATPGLDMRMLGRIDSWINEVENKDAFKNGHARQTAEYALAIARECGVPEQQLVVIRQAALVHDVGKLGSPPALLQKPESEQEDNELLNIMKHPIAGAELLQGFPAFGSHSAHASRGV
jgi:hypothetical protein